MRLVLSNGRMAGTARPTRRGKGWFHTREQLGRCPRFLTTVRCSRFGPGQRVELARPEPGIGGRKQRRIIGDDVIRLAQLGHSLHHASVPLPFLCTMSDMTGQETLYETRPNLLGS